MQDKLVKPKKTNRKPQRIVFSVGILYVSYLMLFCEKLWSKNHFFVLFNMLNCIQITGYIIIKQGRHITGTNLILYICYRQSV